MRFSMLSLRAKRVISSVLALVLVLSVVGSLFFNHATAAPQTAQGASFIQRSDGVWLWPVEEYSISDWAGCNAYKTPVECYLCKRYRGISHTVTCEANHTTLYFGHNGIDIPVTYKNVRAMADGKVILQHNVDDNARGKYIIIEHQLGNGWSYYSYYQHLNSIAVNYGAIVKAGDTIGQSGSTGVGTDAHLHVGLLLGHSGESNPIGKLEGGPDWVITPGFQEGRILNNPALNSPAGRPADPCQCGENLTLHAGSVMYTLNKNEVNIGEAVQKCTHEYNAVETPATCETDGSTTYTCSKCGDSYTEGIPALGHDYYGVGTAPTCSSAGYTTYTCTRCGDGYALDPNESWSEWSDIYPEGFSASLIQEKTEYRYRDKEFTTSASNELDGWTLIGPTTVYGDYGSWSAWSDTPVSASDERKVETRTVWPYYYFLCTNCGAHMHGYGSCYTWAGGCGAATYVSGWREVWSTTSWDNAGFGDWYGTGKYYAYVDGQLVFQNTGVSSKNQYRYCTREIIDGYSFYRWGEWSEWSDTAYTATDDRNVESRTLYRYYTGPLGEHDWDQGIVTEESTCVAEGVKTHTCQICGEVENRSIPVSDHHYTSEVIGATCTEYSYIRYTCIDCGHSYEVHADEDYSEWSEDYPEGVDGELIESKIEYRYSDYETITSYEPELDGYELIGSEWQESASGTITYASSWPSGFSTSHNLYAAYNHSPKSASETVTDKTVINSDNHTGYIYWHWCRGTYAGGPINRTISDHYTGEYNKFHAFYTTSSGSEFDPSGIYGYGAHYYANGSCCSDSYWYYPISVKTQNYTSYRNLFTYGRWSDWSEWSETEYIENMSRRVENRTLYRYLIAPSGEHSWDAGVVTKEPTEETEGERLYTCTACGATRTETIPVIGHEHRYEAIATAPTCTERGYTTYTCRCGESYTADYVDALGHAWGDWIVIQEPTTTENGVEEHTCTRCGHAEQRSIAKLENPFNDVAPGSFFYEPVMWAIENGITNGTSATTFGPNDQCMRAHVVTFLWRAVGSPEPKLMVNPFVDVKPTDFYYRPVLWALENGITSGMDATHFGPTAYCNRAQVVTFLYRTMGSPDVGAAINPFTDVAAGSFYEKPVLWAVENGVTAGLSATSFGPNSICNRAQIVTFLYRAFVD